MYAYYSFKYWYNLFITVILLNIIYLHKYLKKYYIILFKTWI